MAAAMAQSFRSAATTSGVVRTPRNDAATACVANAAAVRSARMETRAPAEEGPWPVARPGGYGVAPSAAPTDDLHARLAAIEQRLDALEGSIRGAVAEEVQGTVDELRRAVSDLGRLLLRDLDRLTKVLAEHRDAIVDRIQPVVARGGSAATATTAASAPDDDGPAGVTAPEEAEPAPLTGEAGRWRAVPGRRRRRRSPKEPNTGDTRD